MTVDPFVLLLILGMGVATYATRIAGHLILSRFDRIDPRVEAALDAVPAAVLTAIAAPPAFATGPAETLAAIATIAASLRLPIHLTLAIGAAVVIALRQIGW